MSTPRFAKGTTVNVEKSRAEIAKLLTAHGATKFFSGYDGDTAFVGFELRERLVRFAIVVCAKEVGEVTGVRVNRGTGLAHARCIDRVVTS